MIKSKSIELPEETIERNLTYIRGLRGSNRVLDRVYNGQEMFSEEVDDLFYFFNGFGQYVKSSFRIPRLREGHDERLGELEQVLNNVDLMTIEEIEFGNLFKKIKNESLFPSDEYKLQSVHSSFVKNSEGLKGNLDIKELYAKPLQEHLKSMKIKNILPISFFSLSVASIVVATYGLINAKMYEDFVVSQRNYEGLITGGIIFAGVGVISTVFSTLESLEHYTPKNYFILYKKAERMDKFIQRYMT